MKTVKEIMRAFPPCCQKTDTLSHVAKTMLISKIGFLPVVDRQKKVIACITYADVCANLNKKPASKHELKVSEIMRSDVQTISLHDDEASALQTMRNYHLSYLAVVDEDNCLIGLLNFVTIARRLITIKNEMMSLSYSFTVKNRFAISA